MVDKLRMMTSKTVYDIFPVLKHREFWIDSDFATTGKNYIYPRYMLGCSDVGIKNSLYLMIISKKI